MSICAVLGARNKALFRSGFYMKGNLAKFMGTCTFPLGHLHDFSACICTGDPLQFKNPYCFNSTNFLDKGQFLHALCPSYGPHRKGASLGRA